MTEFKESDTRKVWLDRDLTLVEKALLAEIDSFTGNGRSFMKSTKPSKRNTASHEIYQSVFAN